MKLFFAFQSVLLLWPVCLPALVNGGSVIKGLLNKSDLPDTGQEWISLAPGSQVQPADFSKETPEQATKMKNTLDRMLGNNGDGSSSTTDTLNTGQRTYSSNFVDASGTYYEEGAQAWRLIGLYIDCDGDVNQHGSHDSQDQQEDYDDVEKPCMRYLMWAAYVDTYYEGGGIGEYQFYNHRYQEWGVDETCDYDGASTYGSGQRRTAEGNRCARMNCHLPSTHFKLLGYFKEPGIDEWMEQLFKHLGVCIWDSEEYEFMQGNREVWPDECTAVENAGEASHDSHDSKDCHNSGSHDSREEEAEDECEEEESEENYGRTSGLYFHTKPVPGGGMELGIYTDSKCVREYRGRRSVLNILEKHGQEIVDDDDKEASPYSANYTGYHYNPMYPYSSAYYSQNYVYDDAYQTSGDKFEGNVYELAQAIDEWNDAFDIYKICQPCRAYTLFPQEDEEERKLGSGDGNGDGYDCFDDAGYTNVNQCMKFATHTDMQVAELRDLTMASIQGTVLEFRANGQVFGDNNIMAPYFGQVSAVEAVHREIPPVPFLFASMFLLFGFGYGYFSLRKREDIRLATEAKSQALAKPLMTGGNWTGSSDSCEGPAGELA